MISGPLPGAATQGPTAFYLSHYSILGVNSQLLQNYIFLSEVIGNFWKRHELSHLLTISCIFKVSYHSTGQEMRKEGCNNKDNPLTKKKSNLIEKVIIIIITI